MPIALLCSLFPLNDKIIRVPQIGCKINFFIIKKKGSEDSGDESGHGDFLGALLDKSNRTESYYPPEYTTPLKRLMSHCSLSPFKRTGDIPHQI